jgi:hypothetical protein
MPLATRAGFESFDVLRNQSRDDLTDTFVKGRLKMEITRPLDNLGISLEWRAAGAVLANPAILIALHSDNHTLSHLTSG